MPALRLLPFGQDDGPGHMAADEVLLESAATDGVASLRFYQWTTPTLSLGYFQPQAVREELPGLAALPWVRRPSGGAAILHHHELTYALALPPQLAASRESWICRFHRLIARRLNAGGLAAELVPCGDERLLGPVLCFWHHTPGDLVCNGHKLAGSAQRKLRGAVLQHGSILLRHSPHLPQLLGIDDLAGRPLLEPAAWAEQLAAAWAEHLQLPLQPGEWTPAERQRLQQLREGKYAQTWWNARR